MHSEDQPSSGLARGLAILYCLPIPVALFDTLSKPFRGGRPGGGGIYVTILLGLLGIIVFAGAAITLWLGRRSAVYWTGALLGWSVIALIRHLVTAHAFRGVVRSALVVEFLFVAVNAVALMCAIALRRRQRS